MQWGHAPIDARPTTPGRICLEWKRTAPHDGAGLLKFPLALLKPPAGWLFRHTGIRIRSAFLLQTGIQRQVECYGHQARLDSTYFIDGIYLLLGEYDADFDDICRAALQPGAVVVDIGCHAGLTMFSALQAVGDQATVYGFEPDPVHYQRCLTNLQLNPGLSGRVTVTPVALSDRDGTLLFVDGASERGTYAASPEGTVSAPTRSLDSWVAEQGLDRLDFLKSDAEGHETQVLGGARQSIERFRPILFFESLFLHNSPGEAAELLDWLEKTDYLVCGSQYPYPYVEGKGGPFPLDLVGCPREKWPQLHRHWMARGQARRRGRSRLRAVIDSLRNPVG